MSYNYIKELRERYFQQTLKFLRLKETYYKKILDSKEVIKIEDFPFLSREEIFLNQQNFIIDTGKEFNLTLTGCTSEKPLLIYNSLSERERVKNFYDDNYGTSNYATLVINNGNHGNTLNSGSTNTYFLPLKFNGHFELIYNILIKGLPTPKGNVKIQKLVVGAIGLRALYNYFNEKKTKESTSLVKIEYYSSYLEENLLNKIRNFFDANISSFYGLSEFPYGIAWSCSKCSNFHFPISVLPEIKKLSKNNKEADYGELVLSSLYPFSQNQFFLRYMTGDLFMKKDYCQVYGDYGYKFLGRKIKKENSDNDTVNNSNISPIIVADILSNYEEVKRNPKPDLKAILNDINIGTLRFSIIRKHQFVLIIDCDKTLMKRFDLIKSEIIKVHKKNNIPIKNFIIQQYDNKSDLIFSGY